MRNSTTKIQATARTLAMLEAVLADGGSSNVSAIARQLGVPVATAHRQVATLVADGYLARSRGRHLDAGPRLLSLLQRVDEKRVIATLAADQLDQLASELRTVVQLGTLENDMVTYRIKTGAGASDLFTKVGMQLEAYCSAIGKVLLGHLPVVERDAYLAGGPFPALTARTITDSTILLDELEGARTSGHAFDRGEIANGMTCVAVPIAAPDGHVPAAISATFTGDMAQRRAEAALGKLAAVAVEIQIMTFGEAARHRIAGEQAGSAPAT